MENIPNSQTQPIENLIPSFDNLYDNNLAHSIEQFDLERRKLQRFIGFISLGIIPLSVIMFLCLRHIEDPGFVIIASFIIVIIVMLVSSSVIAEGRPPSYKPTLMISYTILFFVIFPLSGFLKEQGFSTGSLLSSIILISISLCLFLFVLSKRALHYAHQYQELVLVPLIEHTTGNIRYMPQKMISEQTFMDSDILEKPFKKYGGFDLLEIEHKHINVELSNVTMITKFKEDGGYKNGRYQSIFLTSNLNKTLSGTTTINRNEFSGLGKFGKFMSNITNVNSFPIETNNLEFERYFKVRSTYPEESKELLTPAFLDRLLMIADKLKYPQYSKTPIFFFKLKLENQRLYALFHFNGIYSTDIFLVPRIIGKVDHRKILQKNYDRLSTIMYIIDALYQSDLEWTAQY